LIGPYIKFLLQQARRIANTLFVSTKIASTGTIRVWG
jgi:hypothetical protein